MIRVLYLSPLIPSSSGSGGRRAVLNHLLEALASGAHVHLLAVDVEAEGVREVAGLSGSLTVDILPRALPRAGSKTGRLIAALQWLLDCRPRAVAVVSSLTGRRAVRRALRDGRYDLVVVEHLNSWGLVSGANLNIPVQYIAHNVETDVLSDRLVYTRRGIVARLHLLGERWKMRRYERKVLGAASSITLIASTDLASPLMTAVAHKIRVWPELPVARPLASRPARTRRLLFVGSAAYFPNRDAIEWLAREFMPAVTSLAPDVVLHIAGTASSDLSGPECASNVVFEGFVSEEKLEWLHRMAELFICPVVLGSGIKIKILEASSYGLPIAATPESLRGISFLEGASLQINRASAAASVVQLLNDPQRLASMRDLALAQLNIARSRRGQLLGLGVAGLSAD